MGIAGKGNQQLASPAGKYVSLPEGKYVTLPEGKQLALPAVAALPLQLMGTRSPRAQQYTEEIAKASQLAKPGMI